MLILFLKIFLKDNTISKLGDIVLSKKGDRSKIIFYFIQWSDVYLNISETWNGHLVTSHSI